MNRTDLLQNTLCPLVWMNPIRRIFILSVLAEEFLRGRPAEADSRDFPDYSGHSARAWRRRQPGA
jgi:hypothetical protein